MDGRSISSSWWLRKVRSIKVFEPDSLVPDSPLGDVCWGMEDVELMEWPSLIRQV